MFGLNARWLRRHMGLLLSLLLVAGLLPAGMPAAPAAVRAAPEDAVLIDNGDPGYAETPAWGASSVKGYNGTATRVTGGTGHTAAWTPTLSPGTYRISFYKVVRPVPSTGDPRMKVDIRHGTATDTVEVDATQGVSGWVELGTYRFQGTGGEQVKLTRTTTASGTYTHADAVRFERVEEPDAGAALSLLSVEGAALSPAFAPETLAYEAQVPAGTESVRLTAAAADPLAALTVNGQPATGGVPNGPVPLAGAETPVTVTVTARDGTAQRIYTVVVRKALQDRQSFVVDYGDYGYSENGSWVTSTTVKGYNQSDTRYTTTQNASIVYRPNIEAGTAKISVYKPDWPDKADPAVRVEVLHNGKTDTFVLDFTPAGAGWLELGAFDFAGDPTQEYVKLTRTAASGSAVYTRADAVKFEGNIVRKPPPLGPLRSRTLAGLAYTEKASIENGGYRIVFHEAVWEGGKGIVKDLYYRKDGAWVPAHGERERLEEQWVVLTGASGNRANYYESMHAEWVIPDRIEQIDARTVELTAGGYEGRFEFRVRWSLETAAPQLDVEFVPKTAGDYVIGYQSFTQEKLDDVTELLSGSRNRAKVAGTVESTGLWELTTPLGLVEKPGAGGRPFTYGIYIPASELPLRFEPAGAGNNQPLGMSLVNNEGGIQPILYAPQFGPYSKLAAGVPYRFKVGLYAGDKTVYEAYTELLRSEYGYTAYRQNVMGQSLTDTMFNMIDLLKIDPAGDDSVDYVPSASGWWSRAKGFIDIENDQSIRTAASSVLLGAYYLTDDSELYDKRALPMLEHGVSRNERGWSPKQKPVYNDPSLWKMGSVAFDVTTLSTFYGMTKGYNAGLYKLGEEDYKVRNPGQYARGPVIQPLMMYRMTRNPLYLQEAEAAAAKYIAEEIDTPSIRNMDRNAFFYQYGKLWVEILELYEETKDPKYLQAAYKEAQRYVSIFTVRPVPEGKVSIPDPSPFRYYLANNWEDSGKYRYPRAKLPEDEPGAGAEAEAWMVSPTGLTYEAGNTNSAYRMNAQEAPFLMRLAEYTGDRLLADIAHNAVVGRYTNYPGYYYRGLITSQLQPDFPLLGPTDGTSIYYHHAPAQLGQTMDYLITEQIVRSGGRISFPSVFETDFLWFKYHVYGSQPGTFYGHPDAWLWMPKGILQSDNPQINWITAESGDKLYIGLANVSKDAQQVGLKLNPAVVGGLDPDKSYPVTVIRDNGTPEAGVMTGGELRLTVSGRGMTAVIVDGLNIEVPLHRAAPERDTAEASYFFDTYSPIDAVKGMLLVKPDKSSYHAYIQAKTTEPATLHYSWDGGATYRSIPDTVYPMEWSVRSDALSETFTYYVESNGKRTRARTLYLPYAVETPPVQPPYEEPAGIVRVDNADAELTGTWMRNTAANGYYYDHYLVAGAVASGEPTARIAWAPDLRLAGKYRVYINVPAGRTEWSADAAYTVYDEAGARTYSVDQSASTGRWRLLGEHVFAAGRGGRIELTNRGNRSQVAADAVMLIHESVADIWDTVTLLSDKNTLGRMESAHLQIRGTLSTGVDGDLSRAAVTYHTTHPELAEISASGLLTLRSYDPAVSEIEVWAEVKTAEGAIFVTNRLQLAVQELEVIIDTSKPGYRETGVWNASGLAGHNKAVKSRYTEEQGATAQWTPVLEPGLYEVSFYRIVHNTGNDPAVQLEVRHGDGTETRTVSAVEGTSGWVNLGTYRFGDAGAGTGAEYVKLTRTAPTAPPEEINRIYTRADAVKFRWVPAEASLVEPADPARVPVEGPLVIGFTVPMDGSTLHAATVAVTEAVYGTPVNMSYAWEAEGSRLTVRPSAPLAQGREYRIGISEGARTVYGTPVAAESRVLTFRTEGDTLPPETVITADGLTGTEVYNRGPVTVTLHVRDHAAGSVNGTYVRVNGGAWQPYRGPFPVEQEGLNRVEAYSVDGAGNREEPARSLFIGVDRTAPVIELPALPVRLSPAEAFVSAVTVTDTVSGVVYGEVLLDGVRIPAVYTAEAFGLSSGTHVLEVRAADKAGNTAEARAEFTVELGASDLEPALRTAYAKGWIRNEGLLNSLLAKKNKLQPLLHELQAQRGKGVDAAFADRLAEDIRKLR